MKRHWFHLHCVIGEKKIKKRKKQVQHELAKICEESGRVLSSHSHSHAVQIMISNIFVQLMYIFFYSFESQEYFLLVFPLILQGYALSSQRLIAYKWSLLNVC